METITKLTEPKVISQLREVIEGNRKEVKDPNNGKTIWVDNYSASAIILVYDALHESNRSLFVKQSILKMVNVSFSVINKIS